MDTSGNLTPSKQEWIYFTGISGLAVTLPGTTDGRGVAGSTAQSHSDGSIVEAVMDVSHWGGLITSYVSQHADAGTHTAITGNTVGLTSNASIAGMTFTNRLSVGSLATISGQLIATNISMLSVASIANNAITGNALATNAITLGYAEALTNQGSITTVADLTSLAVTVTVPAGGRKVKITGYVQNQNTNATVQNIVAIQEGATILNKAIVVTSAGNAQDSALAMWVGTPTAGSHTYKLTGQATAGTMTVVAAETNPAFILVELI